MHALLLQPTPPAATVGGLAVPLSVRRLPQVLRAAAGAGRGGSSSGDPNQRVQGQPGVQQQRDQQEQRQKPTAAPGAKAGPAARRRKQTAQQQPGQPPEQQQQQTTAGPAAAAPAAAGAAATAKPRLTWRGSGSQVPRQGAQQQVSSASPTIATSTATTTTMLLPEQELYSPPAPAPAFFLPQQSAVDARVAEAFLVSGINEPFAAPAAAQVLLAPSPPDPQVCLQEVADKRRQLPPPYQTRLAEAQAAAAQAAGAARARAAGLTSKEHEVVEAVLMVTTATTNPMLSEVAVEVLEAMAAGLEPDADAVDVLLNPLSLMMEDLGFFSPAFDEVAIKAMTATSEEEAWTELDMEARLSHMLLLFFAQCPTWDSMGRAFGRIRGVPELEVLGLPHLVTILRRLPRMVKHQQLGFKSRLQHEYFVASVLEEVDVRAEALAASPADTAAVAVAIGQLGTPGDLLSGTITRAVSAALTSYSTRQLADVLWGLSKAGRQVEEGWFAAVWQQMAAKRRQGPVDTVCLAKALFASALMQQAPPNSLMASFYEACQRHTSAFTPQQLVNTLWAVSELGLRPPPSWLTSLSLCLTAGQAWSTKEGELHQGRAGCIASTDAVAAAAAAVAAAAVPDAPPSVAAAAAAVAAAASSGCLQPPAHVAAAAAAAAPFLQNVELTDGPVPCSIHSLDFLWVQLLSASQHGSSRVRSPWTQQPLLLPPAPPALLGLSPEQQLDIVQALSELKLAPQEPGVALLLQQVLEAAAAMASSSSSPLLVKDIQRVQPQQQASTAAGDAAARGFAGPARKQPQQPWRKSKPQQQQQQQQQPGISLDLVAAFDAATGGLWQQAVTHGWDCNQLAAAAAYTNPAAADAAAAVAAFLPAWYAATGLCLKQTEPVTLVNMLRAVAELTDAQESSFSPLAVLPPRFSAAVSSDCEHRGGAVSSGSRQEHAGTVALPPLPPASWIAAAVDRLFVTRSALAEVALWHSLEAVGQLLESHPQRQQLLQATQQQQQSQQLWYWWREGREAAEAEAAGPASRLPAWLPAPETAAEAAQREYQASEAATQPAWDPTEPFDTDTARIAVRALVAEAEAAGNGWPGNFSSRSSDASRAQQVLEQAGMLEGQAAAGRDWRAGSWLYEAAGGSNSCGAGDSSGGCYSQLQVLVGCLGTELGTAVDDVEALVEEAAAVSRLSPDLLSAPWLMQHEACLVEALETQGGWSMQPGGSSKQPGRRQQPDAAVRAGLRPDVCQLLLQVHEAAGYEFADDDLGRLCRQLARGV